MPGSWPSCRCTLTLGYWKTHSSYGPAKKADPTWLLLPNGPNTTFFSSGKTYLQVLQTPPQGNAYYNFAHQYIAAKLNLLSGADSTSPVDAAIAYGDTFFATYSPSTWPNNKKSTILAHAATLDAYNNGATGPGHCAD